MNRLCLSLRHLKTSTKCFWDKSSMSLVWHIADVKWLNAKKIIVCKQAKSTFFFGLIKDVSWNKNLTIKEAYRTNFFDFIFVLKDLLWIWLPSNVKFMKHLRKNGSYKMKEKIGMRNWSSYLNPVGRRYFTSFNS